MTGTPPADLLRRAAAECLLEGMVEAGLDCVPPAVTSNPSAAAPSAPASEPADLSSIVAEIADCRNCELSSQREKPVPGEGNPDARLMFVGEGPGAEEDRSGRPFVGASGQLLDKIIENGMGLQRQEVFIANVVKCRPPQNRNPLAEEVAACTPFLEQQISAVNPELIIALGRPAAHHLLQTTAPIGQLRGKMHKRPHDGRNVLVTYHPAFLLYEPSRKAECWADIKVAMRFLGLAN